MLVSGATLVLIITDVSTKVLDIDLRAIQNKFNLSLQLELALV